jgi:hypothetical protein
VKTLFIGLGGRDVYDYDSYSAQLLLYFSGKGDPKHYNINTITQIELRHLVLTTFHRPQIKHQPPGNKGQGG